MSLHSCTSRTTARCAEPLSPVRFEQDEIPPVPQAEGKNAIPPGGCTRRHTAFPNFHTRSPYPPVLAPEGGWGRNLQANLSLCSRKERPQEARMGSPARRSPRRCPHGAVCRPPSVPSLLTTTAEPQCCGAPCPVRARDLSPHAPTHHARIPSGPPTPPISPLVVNRARAPAKPRKASMSAGSLVVEARYSSPPKTASPSRNVATTSVPRISASGTVMRSRERTAKSARLPASSEPTSSSMNPA